MYFEETKKGERACSLFRTCPLGRARCCVDCDQEACKERCDTARLMKSQPASWIEGLDCKNLVLLKDIVWNVLLSTGKNPDES